MRKTTNTAQGVTEPRSQNGTTSSTLLNILKSGKREGARAREGIKSQVTRVDCIRRSYPCNLFCNSQRGMACKQRNRGWGPGGTTWGRSKRGRLPTLHPACWTPKGSKTTRNQERWKGKNLRGHLALMQGEVWPRGAPIVASLSKASGGACTGGRWKVRRGRRVRITTRPRKLQQPTRAKAIETKKKGRKKGGERRTPKEWVQPNDGRGPSSIQLRVKGLFICQRRRRTNIKSASRGQTKNDP